MERVATGDAEATAAVAHRLASRVRRLSKMVLMDETRADDAAQNALIEILRSARTYSGRSSLERWADRITARVSIRLGRDERRRHALAEPLEAADVLPSSPDPAVGGLRDGTPRPVQAYLEELPESQREVLVLKHTLEYTTEEIAELLGVPVGTVKDRLVAARKHVRKLIHRDLNLGTRKGGMS